MGDYNAVEGLYFISTLILSFGIIILILLSFGLYRLLKDQDTLLDRNVAINFLDQTLDMFKQSIFWIIGYRGEGRELTPASEVNARWISKYKVSIFFRLFPIYALYIMSLVIIARPVFFENGEMHVFSYTKNLQELYGMFLAYVTANVVFDLLSLSFTLSHVIAAQRTNKYFTYLFRDVVTAFLFFMLSQLVSCALWILKREETDFPVFENGVMSSFFEITFWPYAIITDLQAGESVGALFPGQLLITGTVFYPTILLILTSIVFYTFLRLTFLIKQFLLSRNLDKFCKFLLKVKLITVFNPEEKIVQFGWCNVALLSFLNFGLTTLLAAAIAQLFGFGMA